MVKDLPPALAGAEAAISTASTSTPASAIILIFAIRSSFSLVDCGRRGTCVPHRGQNCLLDLATAKSRNRGPKRWRGGGGAVVRVESHLTRSRTARGTPDICRHRRW